MIRGPLRRAIVLVPAIFALTWTLACAPTTARRDGGFRTIDGGDGAVPDFDGGPRRPQDAAPPLSDGVCARVHLDANLSTPNVILMVDQSSSMTRDFEGRNRWISLRDSLMAPGGLVSSLQAQARFGLGTFTARSTPAICPWLPVVVDPALNNYEAIDEAYTIHTPMGGTPTGPAMDALLTQMAPALAASEEPTILILATDGEPRLCAGGDSAVEGGRMQALDAVNRAHASGIRTFVISVAGESELAAEHLQALANAGAGLSPESSAPFWVAGSESGLTAALNAIVGGELSCTFELMGRIRPDLACTGEVLLNGRELSCGDDWRALDENHVEIRGSACEELMAGGDVALDASFPCDVILI